MRYIVIMVLLSVTLIGAPFELAVLFLSLHAKAEAIRATTETQINGDNLSR
jgi:hypothetical protein